MRRIHRTFGSYRIDIECIIHCAILTDNMRLGIIVAPCVEIQVFAAGEVVLLIDLHPFADERFFLRRKQERTFLPVRVVFGPSELCAYNRSRTNLRSKIVASVRQFNMVAVVCQLRRHSGVCFAFHTHLTRRHRVRSHSLIDLRNKEVVHRTTARAHLNNCIGFVLASLVIDLAEVRRHLLRRIPRALQSGCLVIVGQTAVQVLTVNLQTVEVPSIQEHIQQVFRIGIYTRIHRRQVPTVPPSDIFMCPLLCLEQIFRVLFHQLRIRVGCQRCPPQFGFQSALVALVGYVTHIFVTAGEQLVGVPVAFGYLVTVVYIHPSETEFSHLVQCA